MTKSYKAILFDLDGTLVETFTNFPKLKKRLFEKLKPLLPDLIYNSKLSTTHYLEKAKKLEPSIFSDCMKIVIEEEKLGLKDSRIFADTEKTLKFLKEQKKDLILAIYTNNSKENMDYLLDLYNLRDYFDQNLLLSRDDVEILKPNPSGINLFIKKIGKNKGEILFVGDSHIDDKAAIAAEIDFALVDRKESKQDYKKNRIESKNKFYYIKNLIEIEKIIKKKDS